MLTVIRNGYDSEDHVGGEPAPRAEGRGRLGYFGAVYAGRSPEPLFVAARRLLDTDTVSRQALEFVFYTSTPDLVVEEARRAGVSDLVKMYPLVAHHEALRRMAACDVLIVLTSPQTRVAIPAKIFEYLPLQKPILAVAGPGATAGFMGEQGFGIRVSPSDPDAAVSALQQLYADVRAGRTEKYLASEYRCFSRRNLTRHLADLFDRVCASRG